MIVTARVTAAETGIVTTTANGIGTADEMIMGMGGRDTMKMIRTVTLGPREDIE